MKRERLLDDIGHLEYLNPLFFLNINIPIGDRIQGAFIYTDIPDSTIYCKLFLIHKRCCLISGTNCDFVFSDGIDRLKRSYKSRSDIKD